MINRVQSKVRRPKKLASKANLVTQLSSHLSTMALSFISQASLKEELYILTSFRYSSTLTELQTKRKSSMTRLSRGSSRKLATAHVLLSNRVRITRCKHTTSCRTFPSNTKRMLGRTSMARILSHIKRPHRGSHLIQAAASKRRTRYLYLLNLSSFIIRTLLHRRQLLDHYLRL
jgi:hypothetical protein